jgi:hypothetical protein
MLALPSTTKLIIALSKLSNNIIFRKWTNSVTEALQFHNNGYRGTTIPHNNGSEPFHIFAQFVFKFFKDMTFVGDPVVSKVQLVNYHNQLLETIIIHTKQYAFTNTCQSVHTAHTI